MDLLRLTLLATLVALVGGDVARAAEGSFSLSPARREVTDRPPLTLVPNVVGNTTQVPFDVTAFPVLLRQERSGFFTFSEAPRNLNAAAKILTVRPQKFRLEPGESRSVSVRWNLLPRGARAAAVGVVYQGIPEQPERQALRSVNRLLNVNLLRLPGEARVAGKFSKLEAMQPRPRVLRLVPRVRNTGDVFAAPRRARLVVRDAEGKKVFSKRWKGDVVLPGAERDFPLDVTKVLPAGRYEVSAGMFFGKERERIRRSIRLTGPNELPTPLVKLTGTAASAAVGRPVQVRTEVRSIGSAPAGTVVSLTLHKGTDPRARPLARKRLTVPPIPPGEARRLEAEMAEVGEGPHVVVAAYRTGDGDTERVEVSFTPTVQRDFWGRTGQWFGDNWALLLAVLVAALLGAAVLVLLRRQKRLAAGGASPAESAASNGAVNINTADARTLASLPSVGPRAAERIVAHREEYGPFRSVEDLRRVEGFDDERVEGLRTHVAL